MLCCYVELKQVDKQKRLAKNVFDNQSLELTYQASNCYKYKVYLKYL